MLTDKLGQEIKAGVWIIYGHNLGRCAGLRIGKVLAAEMGESSFNGVPTPWNRQDRITVWGLNDDSVEYAKFHPNDTWSQPKPLQHKSTLLYAARCLVVPVDLIPESYRKMIEEKERVRSYTQR
jgi:hypothetical protein